jgi:peptidoglycan/LPS O-acetylase OafA/YrhL
VTATATDDATSARRTIPALDTLRAVGALAVVTTHVAFQTGSTGSGLGGTVLARLDVGVAVFFVLSGFLLSRDFLARNRFNRSVLRAYAIKRFARIYPVYVVTVVLAMTLVDGNSSLGLRDWVRHLTLTQIYAGPELPEGLTQMWSLATEAAFYLLLPALMYVLVRLREGIGSLAVLIAVILLSVGGLAWQHGGGAVLFGPFAGTNLWLPGYALWFAVGIALAHAARSQSRPVAGSWWRLLCAAAASPGACLLAAVALLLVAATPVAGPTLLFPATGTQQVVKVVLYAAIAALLVLPFALGTTTSAWARWFASTPLRWLGRVSYSLFCVHLVVLHLVLRWTGVEPFTGRFLQTLVATVVCSVAAAAVLYRFVERPAMRWGRRVASPRTTPVATPTDSIASS